MSPLEIPKPFRVAILGTGAIALSYAKVLQSLPNVELTAVCDIDEAKARAFQQQFHVGECFSDLGRMLEKVKPDAVQVLLPAALHREPAEMCLAGGAHIFVEKPFCSTSEDCIRLQRAGERYGRRIGVNHNVTFMPGLLEVIDRIKQRRLGAIEHVTVQYDLPNPELARGPHYHWMFSDSDKMMLELGPHPLSVVYRMVGKMKDCSALASGEMRLSNGTRFYHTWQTSMTCERGTAQVLLSLGKAYPSLWIHVLGQDGDAFVDLWRYTVRFTERTPYVRAGNLFDGFRSSGSLMRQSVSGFRDFSLAAVGLRPINSWHEISIRNSVAAFYQALAGGVPPPVGAEEGTAVIQACEAITRSALQRTDVDAGAARG